MTEPTDEMELVFNRVAGLDGDQYGAESGIRVRDGLAAVLELMTRNSCLERRGHVFHPLDKGARPKWRCNKTARCVLPDGHGSGHAYTGETR